MNEVTELKRRIEQQEQQIRTLKQAVMRLEKHLRSVSVVADRANHQSKRVTEDVRSIQHKIKVTR